MKKETYNLPPISYLTWEDVNYDCDKLYSEILRFNVTFDAIVMILRGGSIPGTILSHKMECDNVYAVTIRTTSSGDVYSQRNCIPEIFIPDNIVKIEGKNVLIIDDVTNTGDTFKIVKQKILHYNPSACLTAAMVWDGNDSIKCAADVYARHTPGWVVFPWEV